MIQLQPFSAQHVAQTFQWVSQPALQQDFLIRGQVTQSGNAAHFQAVLSDPRQRVFAIVRDYAHIGNCGFKHIDGAAAEMWIYLGDPAQRGQAAGSAALEQLLAYGVGELGLRQVVAHVAAANTAARKLYGRCCFAEAGQAGGDWSGRAVLRMLWQAA